MLDGVDGLSGLSGLDGLSGLSGLDGLSGLSVAVSLRPFSGYVVIFAYTSYISAPAAWPLSVEHTGAPPRLDQIPPTPAHAVMDFYQGYL